MTYLLQYRNTDGVQKHFKIGLVGNIKPAPARDKAEIEAGRVAQGIDIQEVRKADRVEAMRSRHGNFGGCLDLFLFLAKPIPMLVPALMPQPTPYLTYTYPIAMKGNGRNCFQEG